MVRIIRNVHARVMEAENSITLTIYTSENVFIALGCGSEMIMGFHECTYQDQEYIIRDMNTKHALYILHSAGNHIWCFLLLVIKAMLASSS